MTLFAVISREMCRMVRQPLYWFCLVAAPILSVIFFTTLTDSGLPQNLPIGIVDQDNTTTSRSITRNLDAFQAAAVTQCYPSVTEARRAVQQGGVSVDGDKVTDISTSYTLSDFSGEGKVVKRGKKKFAKVVSQ